MPKLVCENCGQDAGSKLDRCVRCGSRPQTPSSTKSSSVEASIEKAYEASRRKKELAEAARPRKFSSKGCMSEAEILDSWQHKYGRLGAPLRRKFLAELRKTPLTRLRAKFVERALSETSRLKEVSKMAGDWSREAAEERERLRLAREEFSRQVAREASQGTSRLFLGPLAKTWVTKQKPDRRD